MRALLTNDDGIDSLGLHELARHVEAAGFEVVVVAPSFDASGTARAWAISPEIAQSAIKKFRSMG